MGKALLIRSVNLFFQIIYWIVIARCLFSFFPNLNWYNQPFKAIKDITDPIMEPFRRIIPPISGLDLSPIALLFAIYILNYAVVFVIAII